MSFEAVNLTDRIGSEIRIGEDAGVEAILTPEAGKELRSLLIQRGVLVIRGIHLSDEQQVQLAGNMGMLRPEGEKGVYKITLDKKANANAEYIKGSFLWHMDGTHDKTPVFASLLSARKLSETGGQTEFANTYAAYEELPREKREWAERQRVVHSFVTSMRRAGIERTADNDAHWRSVPDQTHSLVWTHESGRKSLVIGCHADHIEGVDREEGEQQLQALLDWATQPQFTYRHEWTPGDLVIWDNTGVLHRAEPYPLDSGRMMHRTTLMGEESFS